MTALLAAVSLGFAGLLVIAVAGGIAWLVGLCFRDRRDQRDGAQREEFISRQAELGIWAIEAFLRQEAER